MALDAATPRAIYTGNGSASAFPVTDGGGDPIVYASSSEINVAYYVTATDTWTDLVEGDEYTIAGSVVDGVVSNGVVTTINAFAVATAVPVGTKLIIWRDTPFDQPTVFGTAAAFSGAFTVPVVVPPVAPAGTGAVGPRPVKSSSSSPSASAGAKAFLTKDDEAKLLGDRK